MDLEEAVTASSSSEEIREYSGNYYEKLFLELYTVLGLLSFAAIVLIIFVIFKFKKLRREPTNMIMVHLGIFESICLLGGPLTIRVSAMIGDGFGRAILITFFYANEANVVTGICFLLLLLVCDWYLKTYNEAKYIKFSRVYKFFLALIYIVTILACIILIYLSLTGFLFTAPIFTFLAMAICYGLFFIFLVIMNIVHLVKKKRLAENKHNVGLFVANFFFLIWIPSLLVFLLTLFVDIQMPTEVFIVLVTFGHVSPIFNLLYLFYYVDDFNVLLKKVFRCQCRNGSELLEEENVSFNINGIKIGK